MFRVKLHWGGMQLHLLNFGKEKHSVRRFIEENARRSARISLEFPKYNWGKCSSCYWKLLSLIISFPKFISC